MTEAEMSLKDYVEGRFDRMERNIDERLKIEQHEFLKIIEANDLRYQQRFEAQGKALDAAFSTAEKAVNVALAGVDKSAIKTEQTADKRFADLGDLIREQFNGVRAKLDSVISQVNSLENRLNTHLSETSGGQKKKEDQRSYKEDQRGLWAILIAVAAVLVALWKSIKW